MRGAPAWGPKYHKRKGPTGRQPQPLTPHAARLEEPKLMQRTAWPRVQMDCSGFIFMA